MLLSVLRTQHVDCRRTLLSSAPLTKYRDVMGNGKLSRGRVIKMVKDNGQIYAPPSTYL